MKIRLVDLYRSELAPGVLLLISFVLAIALANIDSFQELYKNFVFFPINFGYGAFFYQIPLIHLVNDGLMTLFFLLIGLELKFNLVCGEFTQRHKLILPSAAALGGVIIPALIYYFFNFNTPETLQGWAITIATDTAFMLGILSFFGRLIPGSLRAFIVGFSLIDDVIALLILALFYTQSSGLFALSISVGLVAILAALNYLKVKSAFYYLSLGLFLWIAMVQAGVHGTLAGIILALTIPVQVDGKINPSFHGLEQILRSIVYFLILPLFSFINSGISFDGFSLKMLKSPLALGIIFGLFVGKQLGIFLFSYVFVKLRCCSLPEDVSWSKFYAISALGGIGFTLSLFIGDLTFGAAAPNYVMRLSVIIASLLSALLGTTVLVVLLKRDTRKTLEQPE